MDVESILKNWLKENGYKGLRNDFLDCSCSLNNLLWCHEGRMSGCCPSKEDE